MPRVHTVIRFCGVAVLLTALAFTLARMTDAGAVAGSASTSVAVDVPD